MTVTFAWGTPSQPNGFDVTTALELGVEWQSSEVQDCTGVEFRVPLTLPTAPIPAAVSLWSAGGTQLRTKTFLWSSLAGLEGTLVQVAFDTPYTLSAATTYTASLSSYERFVSTGPAFAFPFVTGILTASRGVLNVGYAFPSTTSPTGAAYHVSPIVTTGSPAAPTITGLTADVDDLDVTATILATDPTSLVGATYGIEWGDGASYTGASPTASHTYAQPGVKALLLRVTDSTDLSDYAAVALTLTAEADVFEFAAAADEIAARLRTIDGLDASAVPTQRPNIPSAIVSFPELIAYEETYGHEVRAVVPIVLVAGKPNDQSTRDRLSAWCKADGPTSVKAVLESGEAAGAWTVIETVTVSQAEFDVVNIADVDYVAAIFTATLTGKGSE